MLNLLSQTDKLWIVTPQAAICYDPQTHGRTVYATSDKHIPVHTFRNSAACIGKEGTLYAGGHGGIIAIKNTDALQPAPAGNVRITDIHLNGKSLLAHPDSTCTVDGQSITLPSTATRLAFTLSSSAYSQHPRTRFAYQLEGMDTSPVVLESGQHTAVFDRLPEGIYTLNVWQTDEGGQAIGPVSTYTVTKQPAWYETWAARLAYVLAGLLVAWLAAYTFARRLKKKNARLLREELTRAKVEYFTNVSHELLTPLTILSCLADEMEQEGSAQERNDRTRVLRDNTDRLKKLIKQVLDFRKMEKKSLALQVGYGDVAAFVRRIGQADFALLAQKKALRLDIDIQPAEIYGFYDADKLEEILFNLLSNAIKYTPEGRITLSVGGKETPDGKPRTVIRVSDTGYGISPQALPHIFERYYQENGDHQASGSGIGLALVKSLVELHQGTITAESTAGEGSTFTVSLPTDCIYPDALHKETHTESKPDTAQPGKADDGDTDDNRPILLVVEDNKDIREYIRTSFEDRYEVLTAADGQEGWDIARQRIPDIIVSDIMMPVMDGVALCRLVKQDVSTSHIPVILLTAKDSSRDKEEGYAAGADSYLNKPFSTSLLSSRIDNLLDNRRRLAHLITASHTGEDEATPHHTEAVETLSKLDRDFLDKVNRIIADHLNMERMDMAFIADKMCMSHSTLYRKVKALTGMPLNELVRDAKMCRAAELLDSGEYTVADVSDMTGFSSVPYFRQRFKEKYGMSPSDYMRRKRKA